MSCEQTCTKWIRWVEIQRKLMGHLKHNITSYDFLHQPDLHFAYIMNLMLSFTCHVGGIWAPNPKAGNILSLHRADDKEPFKRRNTST